MGPGVQGTLCQTRCGRYLRRDCVRIANQRCNMFSQETYRVESFATVCRGSEPAFEEVQETSLAADVSWTPNGPYITKGIFLFLIKLRLISPIIRADGCLRISSESSTCL